LSEYTTFPNAPITEALLDIRVELPEGIDIARLESFHKDFKEYILTNPEVAPKLPQSLSHFFMQIVMPNQEIEASAIITETMEPPTENQRLPLILDIDVFKEKIYADNKEEIWSDFENLRAFKNDIFFNSITDKTEELFK
jgi:hypothetical protein